MSANIFASVQEIIEEARNGRAFILVDSEDRENEGDIIVPAQMITPDTINFMARHARGLICLALTAERAAALDLPLMSPRNQSHHQTAFTVSIEAREGVSTGISVHDRARTISVAIDPNKGAADIVTPGHVFPLVARDGGVLVRAGHTEAAVDVARLAGLSPAGVICEIMNEDGSMARLDDLAKFARKHTLKIATISDLIAYRRHYDNVVRQTTKTPFQSTVAGRCTLYVYENVMEHTEHIALVKGTPARARNPVPVRVHRVWEPEDLLCADTPRASLIEKALHVLRKEKCAVLLLLFNKGTRWLTQKLSQKDSQKNTVPSEFRDYGIGAEILRTWGSKK